MVSNGPGRINQAFSVRSSTWPKSQLRADWANGQDLAQQLAQLDAAGCTKVYREKVSAATAERPQLKRAIGALDAGDVLMVTATDRLARNTRDLLNILYAVKEAGAGFRSIAEPMVDTTSQFAEVVIAVLGIAASYERQRITERTAAGRVQAKARGVKFGRRAALTPHQQNQALQRLAAGDTQRTVALPSCWATSSTRSMPRAWSTTVIAL